MNSFHLRTRKLASEALGTALLLVVVIGSGVMGERLAGGNAAVALLANTLATVAALYVSIEVFGPISGAHFNPAISLVMASRGELATSLLVPYIAVQFLHAGRRGTRWRCCDMRASSRSSSSTSRPLLQRTN